MHTADSCCRVFDPFVSSGLADRVPALLAARAPLRVYAEGPVEAGFGKGLVRRYDAAMNYLKTRLGRESPVALSARLNLFRTTLALHEDVHVPEFEPIYRSDALVAASRELTSAAIVRPAMLYANVLLPGQELALHTDTPEYRGLDKWSVPEWLLVVMCHSGLFEHWRKRVAAGVAFFSDCRGGELLYYPDGPGGAEHRVPARHNTAIHLDVDTLFHGVARVGGPDAPAPPLTPDMTLRSLSNGRWAIGRDDAVAAEYGAHELRMSLQWKANCYADEAEEALVRSHRDDLTLERVLDRLVQDLEVRGRVTGKRPADARLASLLIDAYIRFPDPAPPVPTPA